MLHEFLAIVEAHGGRVEVESSPAHGTTFRVLVPLDARKPADGQAA